MMCFSFYLSPYFFVFFLFFWFLFFVFATFSSSKSVCVRSSLMTMKCAWDPSALTQGDKISIKKKTKYEWEARRKFDQIGTSNYGCKPKVRTKLKGTSIVIDRESYTHSQIHDIIYMLAFYWSCIVWIMHVRLVKASLIYWWFIRVHAPSIDHNRKNSAWI